MSNDLAKHETEGTALYRRSTDAATICRDIVLKTSCQISGRKYVKMEGWQAIATAHGCILSARDVVRTAEGWTAIGEVRRISDGVVLAVAEGFVGIDEPVWAGGEGVDKYGKAKTYPRRAEYACRAMAQTRACSRVARSAFALVVVMMDAGLETTPAEEMQGIPGHDAEEATPAKPSGPAKAPPAAQNVATATPNAGKRPPPPLKNVTPPASADKDLSLHVTEVPTDLKYSDKAGQNKDKERWVYSSPGAGYNLSTYDVTMGHMLDAANEAGRAIKIRYTQETYQGKDYGKIQEVIEITEVDGTAPFGNH